ncbi:beta-N-acetylhexosaminidase [Nonomuraea sp. NPDC050663]|uniref:beta-N-acetylhexosaminidase n=1 Tax=Nonomuraea sp. NPDC050663 TaxID=3364370 RepID=UPI0037BB78D5
MIPKAHHQDLSPGRRGEVRHEPDDPGLGPEGYRISITPERTLVTAGGPAGRFYALGTLARTTGTGTIEDRPRYGWRGVMLDVARHFMPKEFVLKLIDLLAVHRMNVLHLHLTDDQGWRLHIDRYPRLTEVSGEHYTHDDIREIVAYAAERFVTIVPEIEMPGHAQAAIAAYPWLGNDPDRQLPVWDVPGISKHVFSLDERTIRFCQDVLDEVAELFPGPYVHIGGDECPTEEWEGNPRGLDPGKARGWFLSRLKAPGKRLVYWYERDDGPPGAAAMVWLEESLPGDREVIYAPHERTYLDYAPWPGEPGANGRVLTLRQVYGFAPPDGILGVQCQLWTEYMPDPEAVERMAFPRLCAFAEVAWGSADDDYTDFLRRLPSHLARLGVASGPVMP